MDGVDFFPWQYSGLSDDDCRARYNLPGQNEPYTIESDDQIICSTEYSKAIPLENGEVSAFCYCSSTCFVSIE